MKKTIKYTDGEIGNIKIIEDFLPSPEELALKEESTKITISLTRETVDFFKNEAKKHHTQYQKMIRNLLDLYVAKHENAQCEKATIGSVETKGKWQ